MRRRRSGVVKLLFRLACLKLYWRRTLMSTVALWTIHNRAAYSILNVNKLVTLNVQKRRVEVNVK
jgi:hypothetical protein